MFQSLKILATAGVRISTAMGPVLPPKRELLAQSQSERKADHYASYGTEVNNA
jgi:hypothetical protein